MRAELREAVLRLSPRVRAWLELLEEREARIVTYASAGTDKPVLRTTVDLSGDIAFQVHEGNWNGLTSDGRSAVAAAHQLSITTRMNLLAAPEQALTGLAFAIRCTGVALSGAVGGTGGATLTPAAVTSFVDPLLGLATTPLLFLVSGTLFGALVLRPARWVGHWVIAHEMRKLGAASA